MTATPAQLSLIDTLRDGWNGFAANLDALLEDPTAYQATMTALWIDRAGETGAPRKPSKGGTSSAFAAFGGSRPALTDEEYANAMAEYETAYAAWHATHQQTAREVGKKAAAFAREWLSALRVDTSTLDKATASRVIDTLKKTPPHVPAA